jgi:hypothetical protein
MKTPCFLLLPCLLLTAWPSGAQETSENSERLKKGLERFPEADTNKDGILTLEEAAAFMAKRKGNAGKASGAGGAGRQKTTTFTPTEEDVERIIALGREQKTQGPLSFEKGDGLRVVMTGHSWVAPGRSTLLKIAAAAGLDGHRQRHHTSGGGTGAANAIWLKEFGKWQEGQPPSPILVPAIATGKWDVMTWGSYYEDKSEYYTQWIDLCLKYNPEMTFLIQDGWPRFSPDYKEKEPAEIRGQLNARLTEFQKDFYRPGYESLNEKYPGKVRIIPASLAVVDLINRFYDGKVPDLDCVDEKTSGGKKGVYRDGGHLSKTSGVEHLVGYLYYGMLYGKSPELIEGYQPQGVPTALDSLLREIAWKAIVESPLAAVDDTDGDGLADQLAE